MHESPGCDSIRATSVPSRNRSPPSELKQHGRICASKKPMTTRNHNANKIYANGKSYGKHRKGLTLGSIPHGRRVISALSSNHDIKKCIQRTRVMALIQGPISGYLHSSFKTSSDTDTDHEGNCPRDPELLKKTQGRKYQKV